MDMDDTTSKRVARDLTRDQLIRVKAALSRLLEGLTQAQVAELIGTDQSTISGILSGRQGIRYVLATKIAKASGISLEDLLGKQAEHKQPYSLEAAIQFAHANGIPKAITDEFVKTDSNATGTPEDLYLEIRALASKRKRRG